MSTTSSVALVELVERLIAPDRFQAVVDTIAHSLPCDSAVLLRRDGDTLVPVAVHGDPQFAQTVRVPLIAGGDVIGVLAADTVEPSALDAFVAVATASLALDALEHRAAVVQQLGPAREILGHSAAICAVRREVELAAASDRAILITGETGVGKEVVARAVARGPMIRVDCATATPGLLAPADRGTLFLDEIGELPLALQQAVLGVRFIAATNRDLAAEVLAGRFRGDLFESLHAIAVPPLRERRDDILVLAGRFLEDSRIRLDLAALRLTADARAALVVHDWPGNVRELEHAILRAASRAANGRRRANVVIDVRALDLTPVPDIVQSTPLLAELDPLRLDDAVDALKRKRIGEMVDRCHGNWAEAARRLGLDRGNLHRLARRLGMRA